MRLIPIPAGSDDRSVEVDRLTFFRNVVTADVEHNGTSAPPPASAIAAARTVLVEGVEHVGDEAGVHPDPADIGAVAVPVEDADPPFGAGCPAVGDRRPVELLRALLDKELGIFGGRFDEGDVAARHAEIVLPRRSFEFAPPSGASARRPRPIRRFAGREMRFRCPARPRRGCDLPCAASRWTWEATARVGRHRIPRAEEGGRTVAGGPTRPGPVPCRPARRRWRSPKREW